MFHYQCILLFEIKLPDFSVFFFYHYHPEIETRLSPSIVGQLRLTVKEVHSGLLRIVLLKP